MRFPRPAVPPSRPTGPFPNARECFVVGYGTWSGGFPRLSAGSTKWQFGGGKLGAVRLN